MTAVETFNETFEMCINQGRMGAAHKDPLIAKIRLIAEGNATSATSTEEEIKITKEPSTNVLYCDFVIMAIKDTDNMPTHMDVSYATSRIMIRDATLEQEQLVREGL